MPFPSVRCVDFVELATDWMEGALTEAQRLQVEEHIAICPHCHGYLAQLRLAVRLMSKTSRHAPPPEAREALLQAFRDENAGTDHV